MKSDLFGFNHLKITAKLYLGFAVSILIVVFISVVGVRALYDVKIYAEKNVFAGQLTDSLDKLRTARLTFLANGDPGVLEKNTEELQRTQQLITDSRNLAWQKDDQAILERIKTSFERYKESYHAYTHNERRRIGLIDSISQDKSQDVIDDYYKKVQQKGVTESELIQLYGFMLGVSDVRDVAHDVQMMGEPANLSDFNNKYASVADVHKKLTLPDELIKELVAPVWQYFVQYAANVHTYYGAFSESKRSASVLNDAAKALTGEVQALSDTEAAKNRNMIQQSIPVMVGISILAVIFGVLAAWYITRLITAPIKENLRLAEHIADGDLTQKIHPASEDELGRLTAAMAKMNSKLHSMISDIRDSVSHVVEASTRIAASNDELASRTEEQSAAVVETAASMEQLTSTVKRNAENAHQASQLAANATSEANTGGDLVRDVVKTMDSITESSRKITEIISVINGISFQTNILALNAAVEAARAGEQGRGFAVVAGEVRMLASRSAQAAKEIESLITESVGRVESGSSLVHQAGKTMESIMRSVSHVSNIMGEIASASDEQSRGIDQISHAIGELDTTTQQNATMVVESSHTAESLEVDAARLSDMIQSFRLSAQDIVSRNHEALPLAKKRGARGTEVVPVQGDNWEHF